jgi:nitrogen fixation/metabolism regulation signal transduction histidine kinase
LSLRTRFIVYLVVVHAMMGALGVYLLRDHRAWLFAVEGVLVASFAAGIALASRMFRALRFVGDSARFLHDSDYTAHFLPVAQPEIDRLIEVYNRMVDHLRTERQRVQEQRHFLSRVMDASPSGILVLDFDGRFEAVNPAAAKLLGGRADQWIGRSLVDAGVPLFGSLAALAPGESRVLAASGGRRLRAQHGRFLDRGFPRSFYLVEELTAELRHSEKAAYEKLIRLMSHEVNNSVAASGSLLQSSLGYGPQLAPDDRADFERALQIACDRLDQLNVFMRGFADVVRLPPPVRQSVALRPILEEAEALTRAQREARRIRWVWDVRHDPPAVSLDRVQIGQALVNIVKNAIEAVDHDGTITVRLQTESTRVRLDIEDNGPGIPPDVRGQLFTPFFTTKPNGQGIGLTLVHEILANHGLDFALEGPPGGPTCFRIFF